MLVCFYIFTFSDIYLSKIKKQSNNKMKKQTLFGVIFTMTLALIFIGCSSSDDVHVTEIGKNNSMLMGKWELVKKETFDQSGISIEEDLAMSHDYPAQIIEYFKEGITIQTDYSSQKDQQGNYHSERSPRQWELIGNRLYLGISKSLEQKADQIYDVNQLEVGQLIIERQVDQYDKGKYSSDVIRIRKTYKKVN